MSGRKHPRHGLSGQCLCKVARSLGILSISGYDDATSPHQIIDMVYDYNTHSRLWYLNWIAMPSFVCPKLACIELLISLHNGRYLFADGFVTVRPIAMNFGWDKENVSSLKLNNFHLNPSNFNRKLTMMFKLDLKKITLTAFRTPVTTKNRTNRVRTSC